MDYDRKEKAGRTWADVVVALPKYIVALLLAILVAMILKAEFSSGVTKYGFLGEWGREPSRPPTADDAVMGANVRLNQNLKCIDRSLNGLPAQIEEWKQYMELTAGTVNNATLRESRIATWKSDVDDVLRRIRAAQEYIAGDGEIC